jgi:hypothetical protein
MHRLALALLVVSLGTSCATPESDAPVASDSAAGASPSIGPPAAGAAEAQALGRNDVGSEGWRTVETALGGQVYVPIYSHIYFRDSQRDLDLAATLSIRNADYTTSIHVTGVRYYDSGGALVRRYLDAPRIVRPMASTAFIIEQQDDTGGVGANFIVEWHAAAAVMPPVIEAVMVEASSGVSFVTPGRVLQRALAPAPLPDGSTPDPPD